MHQMDLTEGVIWKKLILYAGPVVLSSLLQSAYSITDLIVAGWFIGKDGISAINNASQVMMILTQIIMGITTGGNILMGQYFGSKDRSNRVKTNRTMFGFALSAGALLSVLLFLLSRPILAALRAPALEEATAYLQVCSAGLIAIFGYNALAAMLRSRMSISWRSLILWTSVMVLFPPFQIVGRAAAEPRGFSRLRGKCPC